MRELNRAEIFQFEINNIIYRWSKGDIVDLMINSDPNEFKNVNIIDINHMGRPGVFLPLSDENYSDNVFMIQYKCYKRGFGEISTKEFIAHFSIRDMPSKIREFRINKIIKN